MLYPIHLLHRVISVPKMKKKYWCIDGNSYISWNPEEARTWCAKLWNKKKIGKISNISFFQKLNTLHIFWSWLITWVNLKWIQLVLFKMQSRHGWSTEEKDGWTDRQMDKVKPVYLPSTSLAAGIFVGIMSEWIMYVCNWVSNCWCTPANVILVFCFLSCESIEWDFVLYAYTYL